MSRVNTALTQAIRSVRLFQKARQRQAAESYFHWAVAAVELANEAEFGETPPRDETIATMARAIFFDDAIVDEMKRDLARDMAPQLTLLAGGKSD